MTQLLATVFGELGIAQYLNAFLDQGFDTWETILDITESDLYVSGMPGGDTTNSDHDTDLVS
jgi:hypothetical protein